MCPARTVERTFAVDQRRELAGSRLVGHHGASARVVSRLLPACSEVVDELGVARDLLVELLIVDQRAEVAVGDLVRLGAKRGDADVGARTGGGLREGVA